jgi:hypothetical protein
MLAVQGCETFESCFKTLAGRNLLPTTMEDTAGLARWLSPLRRRSDSESKEDRQRCNVRSSAMRVILVASSILVLILMIAATHHPRTQVRCNSQAACFGRLASSILALILMIAATRHPGTQVLRNSQAVSLGR